MAYGVTLNFKSLEFHPYWHPLDVVTVINSPAIMDLTIVDSIVELFPGYPFHSSDRFCI